MEIMSSMSSRRLRLKNGDIMAVASKAVAVTQNRIARLDSVTPSEEASRLAKEHGLDAGYVEIVLRESSGVYGGVWKTLLTARDKLLVANAGVDLKNAPEGCAVLLPDDPQGTAENIRRRILREYGKRTGVLIVDSRVTPLRRGTVGISIGIAGIAPTRDCRSERDLYGKEIHVTTQALADDLASAAHLIMGETREQIPAVLIREAPVEVRTDTDNDLAYIAPEECLYAHLLTGTGGLFGTRPRRWTSESDHA
jgi:coenzyme F420-0:L-glutamate ligase